MPHRHCSLALAVLLLLGCLPPTRADVYRMVVQPVLPPETIRAAYQPLADYLSRQTGHRVELVTAHNFLTYWQTMRRPGSYDLILDAAHFTDWRIARQGFRPLAKFPDVVSFTLVTGEETLVFTPDELIGRPIATLGSPSLGAVRLAELFPNPAKQPRIVEVNNSTAALELLRRGEVVAAMIPSPLVRQYSFLNTVTTTEQVPHMCLSAGPTVPPALQARLRDLLVGAREDPEGQAMLRHLGIEAFEPADREQYAGYRQLLRDVWGY